MSLDLFAAFEDTSHTTKQSSIGNSTAYSTQEGNGQVSELHIDDGDEEFGDFEDAEVPQPAAEPQAVLDQPQHASHLATKSVPETTGNSASKTDRLSPRAQNNLTIKGLSNNTTELGKAADKDSRIGRHPFADHMDVLFGADEDEYDAGQDEWHDLSNNPEAAVAYSKRVIQEQLEAQAREAKAALPDGGQFYKHPEALPVAQNKSEPVFKPRNLDVLFDANDLSDEAPEDANDDDIGDWGNFEDGTSVSNRRDGESAPTVTLIHAPKPSHVQGTTAAFDLLGLDEPLQADSPSNIPSPEPMVTTQSLAARQPLARSAASFNAIIEKGFTDAAWDDFEDSVPSTTVPVSTEAVRKASVTVQSMTLPKLPPANVPPPSVLLSAFPALLKQPLSQATIVERVATASVLAHILAGRKQRWKRSATLAASMRIGPAAVGGKGGMKLTGLDRTETAKEDREVAEALAVWRAQLGRFRSAYATYAGSTGAEDKLLQARLPDVNDPAPIRTLKPQEGGLTAPHECALCGLRRQERIVNVDDSVDDSFGEWWTEGADMHTACALWWVKHETALRSR